MDVFINYKIPRSIIICLLEIAYCCVRLKYNRRRIRRCANWFTTWRWVASTHTHRHMDMDYNYGDSLPWSSMVLVNLWILYSDKAIEYSRPQKQWQYYCDERNKAYSDLFDHWSVIRKAFVCFWVNIYGYNIRIEVCIWWTIFWAQQYKFSTDVVLFTYIYT